MVTAGGGMAPESMKYFTTSVTHYLSHFSYYIHPLLHWGQWLFLSLLTLNLVWMALWHAFDHEEFSRSLPIFIRKFFLISIFYTIMIHPEWLTQLLQTSEYMGGTLTKISLTPQAIIQQGITFSNKLMIPLAGGNLLTGGAGFIVALLVALLVLFVFLSVTVDLLVTLITTTFLISMASFFLGLAPQSETVACRTLNAILSNCMKLFGLYVVIAVGLYVMKPLMSVVPMQYNQLDPYVWISAIVLLFWFLSKNLPRHLSVIVAELVQLTPTTTSTMNSNNSYQIVQARYASTNEKMSIPGISSLLVADNNKVSPISTTLHTTISNGNLSSQFGQLVRKLATHSRMTSSNKYKNNKKSKVNK